MRLQKLLYVLCCFGYTDSDNYVHELVLSLKYNHNKVGDTRFPLGSRGVTYHSHSAKIFIKVENFYSAAEDGEKFLK